MPAGTGEAGRSTPDLNSIAPAVDGWSFRLRFADVRLARRWQPVRDADRTRVWRVRGSRSPDRVAIRLFVAVVRSPASFAGLLRGVSCQTPALCGRATRSPVAAGPRRGPDPGVARAWLEESGSRRDPAVRRGCPVSRVFCGSFAGGLLPDSCALRTCDSLAGGSRSATRTGPGCGACVARGVRIASRSGCSSRSSGLPRLLRGVSCQTPGGWLADAVGVGSAAADARARARPHAPGGSEPHEREAGGGETRPEPQPGGRSAASTVRVSATVRIRGAMPRGMAMTPVRASSRMP